VRPADWSPLGLSADPVPGDAVLVLAGGNDYLEVADAIERSASRMRQLDTGGMVSEALDSLMDKKEDTVEEISRAYDRYRATGDALVAYASALESAQRDSAAALDRARAAAADAESASSTRRYYLDLADGTQDPAERTDYEQLAARYGGDADAAAGTVAAAQADVEAAVELRDRAAEDAVSNIEDVIANDGLKDGWWDNWGSKLVAAITDIAGWVSTIAGVLALAVSWIPVVGQALAAALLVVAAVAAVINAIGNIVLASTGERSWTEAVISIAGAALSCIGLGGAARLVARTVTTRVLLREAGTNTHMINVARVAITAYRPSQAVRLLWNDPLALLGSARAWAGALRAGSTPVVREGDTLFRVYGDDAARAFDGAARGGASWTTVDPRTLHNPRSIMGLPSGLESGAYNEMTDLVVGRLDDVGGVAGTRHGLPLDGHPGGAPEVIAPNWERNGAISIISDQPFAVR
jgi:hypothetical protein